MARYINEDEFIAWVKEHWCADCQNDNGLRCRACWIDDAIDIVEEAPEADVVPKSEYDAVVSAVDNSTNEFLRLHDEYQKQIEKNSKLQSQMAKYQLELHHSKKAVAREIFKEFERLMENNEVWFGQTDEMREEFAKLKKKYTEEK